MTLYCAEITIAATVYVQAKNKTEAKKMIRELHHDISEDGFSELISGARFDDPDLPEISLSPAMTLYADKLTIDRAE